MRRSPRPGTKWCFAKICNELASPPIFHNGIKGDTAIIRHASGLNGRIFHFFPPPPSWEGEDLIQKEKEDFFLGFFFWEVDRDSRWNCTSNDVGKEVNLYNNILNLIHSLLKSSTIYFQLFQRFILVRKQNLCSKQDYKLVSKFWPNLFRDCKRGSCHERARVEFRVLISPSAGGRAHGVTASSAETKKVGTRRASPSQGNLAPAWASVLAGWLVFQRSPPVWESRATLSLLPPSSP